MAKMKRTAKRGLVSESYGKGSKIKTRSSRSGGVVVTGRYSPRMDKNFSQETKNKSAIRSRTKKKN